MPTESTIFTRFVTMESYCMLVTETRSEPTLGKSPVSVAAYSTGRLTMTSCCVPTVRAEIGRAHV